ncbi:MAG: HAMP domain-containing histidine kinase [Clostridia bacterium]|nr:HAMP domain-containing histidine kinase [Clostridia bacterium]
MSNRIKRSSTGISIRWKLAVYLAVFIALVLVVIWIFQVYLLNTFYEYTKEAELTSSAAELATHLNDKDLSLIAHRYAVDCTMSVGIYRLDETEAVPLANVDATGEKGMNFSNEMLTDLYKLAKDNGGTYLGRGRFVFGEGFEEDQVMPFFEAMPNHGRNPYYPHSLRLMCVKLVENDHGNYLILLNAGLQPLDSTVQTLQTQFVWITVILLLGAVIMVFLLYRHISSPLVSMNNAAKQLARGKYDVTFSGKGYSETRELADTLNYASHELSRLDRLQKELIANISHDLRTPLTMIKGYSEVVRDIPGENTPENMQVIIDETTRLSELVNDLLDLSRIQSGARKADKEFFDLTLALEETIKRCDTFVRHRGYVIETSLCDAASVYADRGMILQVLYNLINNAINYTGEDKRITVTQSVTPRGTVRISVRDTGEGIEADQIPLIWDRYYKVDKVHRRAMIGTGLGLSIVKEILELHGAAYGVNSTVGEGSEFWFELPVLAERALPQISKTED